MVAGIPAAASGSGWTQIGEAGWHPAVAVSGGAVMQEQNASVESFCAEGGEGEEPFSQANNDPGFAPCQGILEPSMTAIRTAVSDSDWVVAPTLDFDLELSTPAIEWIPGDPRLFFRGEVQLAFGPEKRIVNEGNPTGARLPENTTLTTVPTFAFLGVGSEVTSEIQTLGWGAGAGIAFPFELFGRRVWVKPGFAWTRYKLDVNYRVEAAVKNDPEFANLNNPILGNQLRTVSLGGSRTASFDGIGPSLELELDVGHFGPIGASVFANGSAYKILGDRSLDFAASASFEATEPSGNTNRGLPEDTYTANWTFDVDPWLYRAAVGIRLHWFGF